MAAFELAQRAVRVAGVVASPSACWGALQPRPVVPSLPAGGDLRRMGQEGLVTLGCLSTGLPAYGGLHRGCRGFLSIPAQAARLHFQQSPSISKAIFTYLRQKELRVGGQIISLLFLQ